MSTFGEILKSIRKNKKMSQEELATLLNTTKQVISRYENNQRSPKVSLVAEYAEALGVPISVLLGEAPLSSVLPSEDLPADPQEEELLEIYRGLNAAGQGVLMGTARGLSANPDMKKGSASNTETA